MFACICTRTCLSLLHLCFLKDFGVRDCVCLCVCVCVYVRAYFRTCVNKESMNAVSCARAYLRACVKKESTNTFACADAC